MIGLFFVGLLPQAKAQATSSVTLAWNPPNGASGIAGYHLYYGTSSGSYSDFLDVGNTTVATVSSLADGLTYYFAVTDYNTAGFESGRSNQVSFTTAPSPTPSPTPNPTSSPTPNPTPSPTPNPTHSGQSPAPIAKDFNGHGYADLVWENSTTGQRVIWFLVNGVYSSFIFLPTVPPAWHIAGVGDFLGNGQSDLVWENTVSGDQAIWILNNGVLQYSIGLPNVSDGWHIVGAGDFNGDGYADLVWENTTTGQRVIWFLVNGVYSSFIFLPTVPTDWHIVDH